MKKSVFLLCIFLLMLITGCSKSSENLDNAFREGYYYLEAQSDEKQSCFYEFINGNLTVEIIDDTGVVDASPMGTYTESKDVIVLDAADGVDETYTILADGCLQSSNGLLLEYRGSEEPKHMGSTKENQTQEVSPTVTPCISAVPTQGASDNEEVKMFEGTYVNGSMGFEYDSYIMSFVDGSTQISVTSPENPEIAFFCNDDGGIPVTNDDLVGETFKVYYKEKTEIDSNTEEEVTVLNYVSAESVEVQPEDEGKYSVIGVDDITVETFVKSLQDCVRTDSKEDLADMIAYPINVYEDNKSITIQNKKNFIKHYDSVFNTDFKQALLHASCDDMFANYSGVMFGSNEKNVWINSYSDSDAPLSIIAINN